MQSHATDGDQAAIDLGPLAWVLDELRKSLQSASSALRRYVRDTGLARGSDLASVDDAPLRMARQQLHQAAGALEMVGLPAPAQMLRSMEAAVQRFSERPELCTEAAAAKIEGAGFALTQYLGAVLGGEAPSAVALFPQYRATQELAGSDRIHPADLWDLDFRWTDPELAGAGEVLSYEPALRSRMDQAVLRVVRSGDAGAGRELCRICVALAAGSAERQPRIFWKISAAYFEALGLGLLPLDVYVKRAASRVLMQYAQLAKGDVAVSDRLAQDLLFFCSQARPTDPGQAPVLGAVRAGWGLAEAGPVDYEAAQYGHFDPLLQAQARKRLGAAKEVWSGVANGDANKMRGLAEQFQGVCESLVKLHPDSAPLAAALGAAVDAVACAGTPPSPELALEVATAMLYLEASFSDLGPADMQLATRSARLAERLDTVRVGGRSAPLEPWIEELYGRVSDRQTMGSVVDELRGTLGELENVLDAFFREPADKTPLQVAPGHLSQMGGVLSMLGLEQAAQAVLRMREQVEQILAGMDDDVQAQADGTFERLGNNLGALGFLIDMLNYQPALAKKLFVYDDAQGELTPLMGRRGAATAPAAPAQMEGGFSAEALSVVSDALDGTASEDLSARLDVLAMQAILADQAALAQTAREASAAVAGSDEGAAAAALSTLVETVHAAAPVAPLDTAPAGEFDEDDLRGIFLEEAREVVQTGLDALEVLAQDPRATDELTTLRRAFHTLKGSSRMVGLTEFGDAGWSMEQLLNTWLADQKPASEDLCRLCGDAMRGFGLWAADIARNEAGDWKAEAFRQAADALRTDHRRVALVLPSRVPPQQSTPELPALLEQAAGAEPAVAPPAAGAAEPLTAWPALSPDDSAEEEFIDLDGLVAASEPMGAGSGFADAEPGPDVPGFDPRDETPEAAMPLDLDLSETGSPESHFGEDTVPEPSGPDDSVAFGRVSHPHLLSPGLADRSSEGVGSSSVDPPPSTALEVEGADEVLADGPREVAGAGAGGSGAELAAIMRGPEVSERALPVVLIQAIEAAADADASTGGRGSEEDGAQTSASEPESADDQFKVIGELRLGIPLYNVYLNEADEWSRRLLTELSEWALELDQRLPDSAIGLAHALGGASATVGFHALSEIARTLEMALSRAQGLACGTPQHGRAFTEAAEEIRRLLHQFAAGFLKQPDPAIIPALLSVADLPGVPAGSEEGAEVTLASGTAPDAAVTVPGALHALEQVPFGGPHGAAPAPSDATGAPLEQAPDKPLPPVPGLATEAAPVDADEDQIDAIDAVDFELFPIFEDEAAELMPQLGGALRQWAARPENRSARDEVLRTLHTLKGSARLAGALRLGELAHRLESEIEQISSGNGSSPEPGTLLHRYDHLQATFERLRANGGQPEPSEADDAVAAEAAAVLLGAAGAATDRRGIVAGPADDVEQTPPTTPVFRSLAQPAATVLGPQRQAANHAVRVRSQLLDRLVSQAGEVMMTRSRLEAGLGQLQVSLTDLTSNLERLRSQLRDIEVQAESQMQSRLAQARDSAANFDPLEFDRFTRVQELTRMMAESVNDVATVQRNLQRTVEATQDGLIAQARQTRELQRDLLRTRMVEFEGISDRLYRVVRLASKETGKQVRLDISGGSIEMDRGVLDRMTPAFEHLLRNCVAHGIEDAARRAAAGKSPVGNIAIELRHEGNDVSVEFRDDGAGLELGRVRQKALEQGLIRPGQVLDDREAANLIFMPGFTTASEVTELAGRGIGMDVVRSEVNALGGRIETRTEAGRGTSFKLVLPLTTAVTQVVMVRSGGLTIGVPANLVETVLRVPSEQVEQGYVSGSFELAGEQLPFYWSGALLQASARSSEPPTRSLTVVVFRSASQRVAVHVDQVLGNQEVVVKNLGPQLARLPGLAGMTMLASGAVVLIYNPVALTAVYGEQARRLGAGAAEALVGRGGSAAQPSDVAAATHIPLVLVVDDSITVRRVTQRLLQREGYRVVLAADGLQALARLAEETPAVILSDIEMPRMDGFDLARTIRSDPNLAALPIIMITSRIAAKHRELAMALGVNHYLGKPYSDERLLSLVRHHCGNTVAA